MATTSTTRLGLVKPTPGSGEPVDVAEHLNDNWDRIDAAIGATICTVATRPASPFDGQIIRETDTGRFYGYNSTNTRWEQFLTQNATFAPTGGGSTAGVRLYTTGTPANNRAIAVRGSGDTQDHWFVDYDGAMQWGPGSGAADVGLSRVSAGVLEISGLIEDIPKRIATSVVTADSSTFTTTLTSIGSVTAALVSGKIYRVTIVTHVGTSVADDEAQLSIYEDSIAGTELQSWGGRFQLPNAGTAGNYCNMEAEYTAVSTGNKTFHLSCQRVSGSGNLRREADTTRPQYIYVDYVRG